MEYLQPTIGFFSLLFLGAIFSENIKANAEVQKYLSNDEIHHCLEPDNYVGHSQEIIDKVLASINE